jgi:hypothetical protein
MNKGKKNGIDMLVVNKEILYMCCSPKTTSIKDAAYEADYIHYAEPLEEWGGLTL